MRNETEHAKQHNLYPFMIYLRRKYKEKNHQTAFFEQKATVYEFPNEKSEQNLIVNTR